MIKKIVLLAAVCLAAASCETVNNSVIDTADYLQPPADRPDASAAAQDKAAAEEKKAASAAKLDSNTVAVIGKYVLTKEKYNIIKEYMKQRFDYTLTSAEEKEFLEYIINKKLMALQAREEGYAERRDVQIKYEWDFDDIVSHVYYNENVEKKAKVTPQEARKHYDENKADFVELKAQHILIKNREMAQGVMKRLGEGEPFEDLAKKYSDDETTKNKGGSLGFFSKGVMVKEFEDAAYMLSVNEVSKPVKTIYGWHLIKVTEKKPVSFDESKDKITAMINAKRKKEAFDSMMGKLREKYEVRISNEFTK